MRRLYYSFFILFLVSLCFSSAQAQTTFGTNTNPTDFIFQGQYTDGAFSGVTNARRLNAQNTRMTVVVTGTTCKIKYASSSTQYLDFYVDGVLQTRPTLVGTGVWQNFVLTVPGFSGLADQKHLLTVVSLVTSNGNGPYLDLDALLQVTGASPAVSAPATVSTTITTGTASATQTVGSTADMFAGDTVFFATSGTTRVISSVTNSTTLVLSTTVTTTTSEVVKHAGSNSTVYSVRTSSAFLPDDGSGTNANANGHDAKTFAYGNTSTDGSIRWKGTAAAFKIFLYGGNGLTAGAERVTFAVDGVEQANQKITMLSTNGYLSDKYQPVVFYAPDPSAEHEYRVYVGSKNAAAQSVIYSVMPVAGTINNTTLTPLETWVAYGDSISRNNTQSGFPDSTVGWFHLLSLGSNRNFGPYNMGFAGSTVKQFVGGPSANDAFAGETTARANSLPAGVTKVILIYGHNDANNNGGAETAAQFQASYYAMMNKLTTNYPTTHFYCVGILPMASSVTTAFANRTSFNTAISNAVTTVGDGAGNVLSLGQQSQITYIDSAPIGSAPYNFVASTTGTNDTITDGIHLTTAGNVKVTNFLLANITGGSGATTYTFTGPSSGVVMAASTNFTVALPAGQIVSTNTVVTPNDNGGGGTFTPSTVTFLSGVAGDSHTFMYTPATTGVFTLRVTNGGSLTNPSNLGYTSNPATATSYTLTAPTPNSGFVGVASQNFIVALPSGQTVPSTVTITPSSGGGGGTFTPTTVTLAASTPSASATFTYTPASTGVKTISTTNSSTLSNPTSVTYTSNTTSFTVAPTALPSVHVGNLTLTLTGSGTVWTTGVTVFTISGVAGVAKVSQNITSTTAATVVISGLAGTTGTLVVGDGISTTNVPVGLATLSLSPSSGSTGTVQAITATGVNTTWSLETASTLFTLSGGTGASIASIVVNSNTSATFNLTVGSVSGTLTVTDASTTSTSSFTALAGLITLTSPVAYQGRQRNAAGYADLTVSGSISGFGGAQIIEASFNGGAYKTIQSAVTTTFTGTLKIGTGQGTVRVRSQATPTIFVDVAYVTCGDVWIVAGQSNASGRLGVIQPSVNVGTPVVYPAYQYTSQYTGSLKSVMLGNDYVWKETLDPIDWGAGQVDTSIPTDGPTGLGFNSYFAILAGKIMQTYNIPIILCINATGGSSIAGTSGVNWSIPSNHQDRTTYYGSLVYRALQCGGCKVILWHQGENDSQKLIGGTQETAGQYQTALALLADAWAQDLGCKLMPCTLQAMGVGYGGTGNFAGLSINTQIRNLWNVGNILHGPDLIASPYNVSALISDPANQVHLTDQNGVPGQSTTMAQAWYDAMVTYLYPAPTIVTGSGSGLIRRIR